MDSSTFYVLLAGVADSGMQSWKERSTAILLWEWTPSFQQWAVLKKIDFSHLPQYVWFGKKGSSSCIRGDCCEAVGTVTAGGGRVFLHIYLSLVLFQITRQSVNLSTATWAVAISRAWERVKRREDWDVNCLLTADLWWRLSSGLQQTADWASGLSLKIQVIWLCSETFS